MATIRWQLRLLFLGLLAFGVLWIHAHNFVRLDESPLDMSPRELAMVWGGALGLGLVLDLLAGRHLRRFFAALARLEAGGSVAPPEAHAAAATAIHFPWRAAAVLLSGAAVLTVAFHAVSYGPDLFHALRDREERFELLNLMAWELTEALVLALLLFVVSRRLLQPAVAALGLREAPTGPRLSVGMRVVLVVLAEAVTLITLAISAQFVPPRRLLWLYAPLGLVFIVTGYLVAADTGQNLTATAARLRGLAAGLRPDLFHRLAVTGQDEVADLVGAINIMQDRVEEEFRAIERDLQAARTIQMELLPRAAQAPPGWDLAVRLTPAQEVGGDFFDVIPLGEGKVGLALGDAAGKGLPAALLMASTVSLLRSHAPRFSRPRDVLEAVNRLLCSSLPPMTFVTAAYAVVDVERREVTLASAGHLPPIIGGREAEPLSGLPLGVEPEVRYEERTYVLHPGESFLLYTDGLVEAPDSSGTPLGTGRIEELMRRAGPRARAAVDELLGAVARHGGGRPVADDVTALVLVPPAEMTLELPSLHGSELVAAAEASGFARAHGPADRADDVATAVGEVCLNAIVHGNGLREELPVVVRLRAGPNWLEATVSDAGVLFDPPEGPPDLREQMEGEGPIRGWGLHLARVMSDEMRVEPLAGGKQVRLRFHAGKKAPASGGRGDV